MSVNTSVLEKVGVGRREDELQHKKTETAVPPLLCLWVIYSLRPR